MDRSEAEVAGRVRRSRFEARGWRWSAVAGPGRKDALFRAFAGALAAERDRWSLWLPVGLAAGVAAYFALAEEPPLFLPAAATLAALMVALTGMVLTRRGRAAQGWVIAGIAVFTVAGGMALAAWHAHDVAAPVLAKRVGPVPVTGRVIALEPGLKGARITLEDPTIGRLAKNRTPKRVRVRVRGDAAGLNVGDDVRVLAVLMPPSAPAAPGAFDFARDAWFKRLGAVGFAFGAPTRLSGKTPVAGQGFVARTAGWLADLRRDLHARVRTAVPGPAGTIAAALITGERGDIPPDVMADMRDSGLAHLLAISGLHVGLVTGALFFGLRAVLAAFSGIALRHPIKKWAALAALLGGAGYMLMTGATVPTQRAFLMAGLVFLAVMVDRAAISMRLVAWAAFVVLLIAPESLLGPSFQMSFAAVIALVATYEAARPVFVRLRGEGGVLRRAMLYGAGVLLTTVVAGCATAPFALYHFNRVAAFGLAANLVAVPITALWIMPLATIAFLLVPFGLEPLALAPMGLGIDAVLAVAHRVASWPGSTLHVPGMPPAALAFLVVGGLWVALWRTRLRLAGLAAVAAGVIIAMVARPPDVLIAGDGQSFAVKGDDGRLIFAGAPLGTFERDIWLRRSGSNETALEDDDDGAASSPPPRAGVGFRCDALACIYRAHAVTVSIIRHPEAAAEDCARVDAVVSLVPLRRSRCREPRVLLDRFDLWRNGAYALWLDDGKIRVRTVADARGRRPWTASGPPRTPKARSSEKR